MRLRALAVVGAIIGCPALAQGLQVDDLTAIEARARSVLGPEYTARAEPRRLSLLCLGCAGRPMIDILLGRQTDGTEDRVRSGQTTIAQLEAQCRSRDPDCRLERADVGPAIGWLTSYRLGQTFGATLVLLRDGDMLTIRSLAADPELPRRNIDILIARIAPTIVGP